ncbi:MAG: LPP20 family lipoprotein [Treponema sp.]|jgi:hypothetical protein|nr:LPP20 family lipoprotein [Treponema sp.]
MYQIIKRWKNAAGPLPALISAFLALAGITACATAPRAAAPSRAPEWVNNADAVYPPEQYIAAPGYGRSRSDAEKNALGSLVAIFGQSVQGEITATYKYSEAVSAGLIKEQESAELSNTVKTSFSQDSVYGAEIKETWFDGKDTHYAVAVMEKLRCAMLYTDLIESNNRTIEQLTGIPEKDRYSLDALSRYELAALIADANDAFINILAIMNGASAALYRDELRRGDAYRLAFQDIARNIPIAVTVDQDRGGRVGQAFAQALSQAGFRTGAERRPSGGNAPAERYVLEAALSLEPVKLANNRNEFVRYIVNAKLWDRQSDQLVFPYSVNGREGHATLTEAENRALRAVEKQIQESFVLALRDGLTQIAPKGGTK